MRPNLMIDIICSKLLVIFLLFANFCENNPYIRSDNCSESQFFDTFEMKCQTCVNEMIATNDPFHQNKVHIKSSDNVSCVCRPGFWPDFIKSRNMKGGSLFCTNDTSECPFGSKPMNGFLCAVCLSNQNQSSPNGLCECPQHHYLVTTVNTTYDNVIDLKCEKCHKHSMVSSDGLSCRPCHHTFIKVSDSCECTQQTHIVEDGMCLRRRGLIEDGDLNSLSLIDLEDRDQPFTSDYFYRRTRAATYNCRFESNRTACQLLANLCVLNHYSYFEKGVPSDSNVCTILKNIPNLDLFYSIIFKGIYISEMTQINVPNRFKIKDEIQFIASRFSVDGQLISYSDLKSEELQLCYEDEKSSKSGFIFNTNFRQTCVRTAKDLWDNYQKKKNIFFELYLKNITNTEIDLYPIRVLNKNLKRNDILVNSDVDDNDSNENLHSVVLTKRFFLIDSITGIEKSDDSTLDYNKIQPQFIRIAKSIKIDVKLRKQDGTGSIYPPLITILYQNIYRSDYESNSDIKIDFSIIYSMNESKTNNDLSITISVLCCAAVLWSIFRTWCWAKRNGKIAFDFFTIIEFIINTIGWLSIVFFVVNIFFAINTFIVFKNQSVIHTLIPTEEQENSLIIYLIIAFLLKTIHLIYKLLVIATIDIFFVDWERPKKRGTTSVIAITRPQSASTFATDSESLDKLMTDRQSKPNSGIGASFGSPLTSPSPKLVADKPLIEFPNVTVWRTHFVANEWMELCGERRLSLSIHILLLILLLEWFGFANLSFSDPNNSFVRNESRRYVPQSTTCRLAVGALVYISLALINILFKKFIYESLLNDKLNQFVDLCSVCNISLFAMVYKRFGYYIHGLAANGKSDVNMLEMYELLEREESDLCSKRGLLPNSDHQTFEMSLPPAIYEHYQKVRSNLSGFGKLSDRMRSLGAQTLRIETDKLIPTYLMINKFLTGFIEHNFKDVDYIVREKSTIESILDVEFVDSRDKGFFYSDNGHSFEAILFYGLEFTLLCFEIMLFLVMDICFQSFTCAAVITFIVSMSIRKLYVNIARKNLVRKALLDQRFLI